MAKKQQTATELIEQIHTRLDSIEELMSFAIRASSRFKRGQRVKLSPRAKLRFKGGATKGRVTKVGDSFTVEVLIDGYKRPHSFHHGFFDPVIR